MLANTQDMFSCLFDDLGEAIGRGGRMMLVGTLIGLLLFLIYLLLVIIQIMIDPIGIVGILLIGVSLLGGATLIIWDRFLSNLWAEAAPGIRLLSLALIITTVVGEMDFTKVLLGGVALLFAFLYFQEVNKK